MSISYQAIFKVMHQEATSMPAVHVRSLSIGALLYFGYAPKHCCQACLTPDGTQVLGLAMP